MNFFWLVVSHYIGDFVLQDNFQAQFKKTNKYIMLVHCLLWTASVSFVLNYLGILSAWKVAFLLVGHYIIDTWKCNHKDQERALTKLLYIDQFLHMMQLLVVYFVK